MVLRIDKKNIFIICALLAVMMCTIVFVFALDARPGEQIKLPVIMYHQVLSTDRKNGRYVISADQLESDLKYLADNGYTTIDVADAVDFVYRSKELPDKCVMLTFDDGFESIIAIVEPLMKKNGMCCVSAVIGSVADKYSETCDHNLSYSCLTWDEVSELSAGDTVEIQNHSYDMHYTVSGKRKGMRQIKGESNSDYINTMTDDITKCQRKIETASGISPTAMVYPLGEYNGLLSELVKDLGFKASFICEERVNTITQGDSDCLFNLGRYNRPAGISSEAFFSRMLN